MFDEKDYTELQSKRNLSRNAEEDLYKKYGEDITLYRKVIIAFWAIIYGILKTIFSSVLYNILSRYYDKVYDEATAKIKVNDWKKKYNWKK